MIIESPEPYVDAEKAAEFLAIKKRELLKRARLGELPGHPLPGRQRRKWRFRLSELAECMQASSAQRKIPAAAPVSRRRKSNG